MDSDTIRVGVALRVSAVRSLIRRVLTALVGTLFLLTTSLFPSIILTHRTYITNPILVLLL